MANEAKGNGLRATGSGEIARTGAPMNTYPERGRRLSGPEMETVFGTRGQVGEPADRRAIAALRMSSSLGCRRSHPSQTPTCRFPASCSSRESFARGGAKTVDDPRWRKRMALEERVEARPVELAPSAQRQSAVSFSSSSFDQSIKRSGREAQGRRRKRFWPSLRARLDDVV